MCLIDCWLRNSSFNIPVQIIEWIKNFLTARKQQVILNDATSDTQMVRSGVPQGSVLGPALFLFSINNIVENISSCVRLFADDIIMYSALSCSGDVFRLQRDIQALGCWSKKWRMTFNVSKCSLMFVGKSRNV